ncbi:alpha/beta hydrolase [Microbacterium sp. NPDC087592]|uniref:alpha/beta hydrolase n=1 Tax=Microbacterium sp. NPDC087592 TaxID=3364193 RepID=UPI00380F817F
MSLPGLIDDPARGDAGAVSGYATTFSTRAASSRERKGDADAALASITSMTASAADALGARVVLLSQRMGEAAEGLDGISTAVSAYATALEGLKSEAARRLRAAQNAYDHIFVRRAEALSAASEFVTGWALPWDAVLPSWMYVDDPSYLRRWQDAIDDYYTARASYNALAEERTAIDQRAVNAIAAVPLISAVTQGGKVGGAGFAAASLAWAGNVNAITAESLAGLGDPDIIRETWNTMDQATRDALLAASPVILGNLNGIPIRDRVTANHTNMRAEIARREAEIARLQEKLDGMTARNHWSAQRRKSLSDEIAELREPIGAWKDLLEQKISWVDAEGAKRYGTGVRVVVFDPSLDAIATYHGPLDDATGDIPAWVDNVAVSVPGTGATMSAFANDDARLLQESAGRTSAVFQWAGGTFPGSIPEAMTWGYSENLAPKLRDFVGAIASPAGSVLTVLGHSYGGATVGLAEAAGVDADRVLYVAAAGMGHGVSGLEDFPNTGDVPHYAMMVRNDSVVGAIQPDAMSWMHGQSAVDAEGVTRLETGWIVDGDLESVDLEDYDDPDTEFPAAIDAHSTIYKMDSTAFNNMVAVITGGNAVVWAPDDFVRTPRVSVRHDGIDMPAYEPEYITIE